MTALTRLPVGYSHMYEDLNLQPIVHMSILAIVTIVATRTTSHRELTSTCSAAINTGAISQTWIPLRTFTPQLQADTGLVNFVIIPK